MAARNVLGLKYLRKDPLQYELRIRGESDEGSVAELSQRLRGALDKPVNITASAVGEVSTACATCLSLLSVVREGVDLLEGSVPSQAQLLRLHALVDHVVNRAGDIQVIYKDSKHLSDMQQLQQEIIVVQRLLSLVKWRDGEERESGEVARGAGACRAASVWEQFSKFPNPLLLLIQGIRSLSVNDVDHIKEVLWLTVKLQKQAHVMQVQEELVCQIIFPLAEGRLSELITDASSRSGSLTVLRQKILRECLGERRRRDLVDAYFYNVQGANEALADYVDRVKTAMVALGVDISEREAVANILEGMRAQDRSRAVFLDRPQTFSELERVVVGVENVRYCDKKRGEGKPPEESKEGAGLPNKSKGQQGESRRCFRCGCEGHLARNCTESRARFRDS